MDSYCFFASYFSGNSLPVYIRVYLQELAKEFDKTVLLCVSQPDPGSEIFLRGKGIEWMVVPNEGYDFGKYFLAMEKYDPGRCSRLALVNDSCVLFKPLDEFWIWSRRQTADVLGMTYSEFRGPHIQSFFMLLRGPAVALTREYFAKTGLVKPYEDVITKYELGLSAFLLDKGLSMASYVSNGGYKGEFAPYYRCIEDHIRQGIPLIKKRILFGDYRKSELFTLSRMNFKLGPRRYARLIKARNNDLLIDPEKLSVSSTERISMPERMRYELYRLFFNVGRPLRRFVKGLAK